MKLGAAILLLCALLVPLAQAAADKPNFLVLFVDDMGINQIDVPHPPGIYSYTGDNHTVRTPREWARLPPTIDRINSRSMICCIRSRSICRRGHALSDVVLDLSRLLAQRGSMMTGRLPVRLGIGIPPCEYAPAAYPPAQNMCNGVFTAESIGGLGEV